MASQAGGRGVPAKRIPAIARPPRAAMASSAQAVLTISTGSIEISFHHVPAPGKRSRSEFTFLKGGRALTAGNTPNVGPERFAAKALLLKHSCVAFVIGPA